MAKEGTTRIDMTESRPTKTEINSVIEAHIYEKWAKEWNQNDSDYKHSKIFLDGPNKDISKELLKLNRHNYSLSVRYITGHVHLRHKNAKHNKKITNILCRHCGFAEETASHLICSCDRFTLLRGEIFQQYFFYEGKGCNWKNDVKGMVAFIKAIDLEQVKDEQY